MSRLLFVAFLTLALGGSVHGQIAFHPAVDYAVGDKPEGATLFDFDGDGDPDLVVSSENPDKLQFLRNHGDGTFTIATTLATGNATSPEGIAVGDFDGDGDRDLVIALFSSDEVQLVLNLGHGRFRLGAKFAVGSEPSMIVAADFNADGRPDAAVNDRVSGDVAVLINDGAGGFLPAVHYAVGIETRCVAAADLSGDGIPDLAVSARDSHLVRLFKSSASGTLSILKDLSLGTKLEPQGVAIADFDHDGKLDVVTTSSGNALQEHASVFVASNGGNPWVGPINAQVLPGVSPTGVAAADFDLDGRVDVATANADTNNVAALKNGGIGIFMLPVFYAVGDEPQAQVLLTGDLDGSGSPDLVSLNRGGNSVSVLLNAKDGPSVVARPPHKH